MSLYCWFKHLRSHNAAIHLELHITQRCACCWGRPHQYEHREGLWNEPFWSEHPLFRLCVFFSVQDVLAATTMKQRRNTASLQMDKMVCVYIYMYIAYLHTVNTHTMWRWLTTLCTCRCAYPTGSSRKYARFHFSISPFESHKSSKAILGKMQLFCFVYKFISCYVHCYEKISSKRLKLC